MEKCWRCGRFLYSTRNTQSYIPCRNTMQLAYTFGFFSFHKNKAFRWYRYRWTRLQPFKCNRGVSLLLSSSSLSNESQQAVNSGTSKPSGTGSVHTCESRAKISASRKGSIPWNKGRNHSKETREKISHSLRLKMADPKIRQALRERQLGKLHSAMTRLRIRLSSKKSHPRTRYTVEGKGPLPYSFSEETIKKVNQRILMSVAKYRNHFSQIHCSRQYRKLSVLFGVEPVKPPARSTPKVKLTKSEETKRRIAESIRAKWKDMEYRSKVIQAARNRPGKPIGEETRRKISQSLRKYYMVMGKSSTVRSKMEKWSEDSSPILFRNQLDRNQRKQQLAELLRKQMEQLSIRLKSKPEEDTSSRHIHSLGGFGIEKEQRQLLDNSFDMET